MERRYCETAEQQAAGVLHELMAPGSSAPSVLTATLKLGAKLFDLALRCRVFGAIANEEVAGDRVLGGRPGWARCNIDFAIGGAHFLNHPAAHPSEEKVSQYEYVHIGPQKAVHSLLGRAHHRLILIE